MASEFSLIRDLKSQLGDQDPSTSTLVKLGKLSTKIEAAGKVRVFAMVDL